MYKLYRDNDDSYQFSVRNKPIKGPFNQVETIILLLNLDFDMADITDSIISLNTKDHYVADFGVNKGFMYSLPKMTKAG